MYIVKYNKCYDSILNLFINIIIKILLSVPIFKNKECIIRNERRETRVSAAPTRAIVSSEPQLRRKGSLEVVEGYREGIRGPPTSPDTMENGNVMAADAGRGR